jgi:hypothetical protein
MYPKLLFVFLLFCSLFLPGCVDKFKPKKEIKTTCPQGVEPVKKLLFIGWDGVRSDALLAANTPHIDSLLQNSLYSFNVDRGPYTVSTPGWSTILHGVWPEKHGLTENSFRKNRYDTYPDIFTLLRRTKPGLGLASLSNWDAFLQITVKRLWSLFSNREYLFVNLGYIFYTFAMGAFSFWGPAFLSRVHGMDIADASLFLGPTLVVGGILGTLIGGYFANKWREKSPSGYARLLLISVLCAVPFSFVSFLTENTLLSMICIALSLIFLFQSTGPINTVIVESVAPNMRASAMAICIFMIHAFGDLWSPELVGRVSDQFGGNLRIGMLILPGAFLLAGLFWYFLVKEQDKKGEQVS